MTYCSNFSDQTPADILAPPPKLAMACLSDSFEAITHNMEYKQPKDWNATILAYYFEKRVITILSLN